MSISLGYLRMASKSRTPLKRWAYLYVCAKTINFNWKSREQNFSLSLSLVGFAHCSILVFVSRLYSAETSTSRLFKWNFKVKCKNMLIMTCILCYYVFQSGANIYLAISLVLSTTCRITNAAVQKCARHCSQTHVARAGRWALKANARNYNPQKMKYIHCES